MTRTLLCVFLPFVILLCSGEVCVDKNSNCRFWDEAINHCELNADYMADTCPVTCNKCGPCRNVSCDADRECVSTSTDAGATYTCSCSDGYTGSDCSDSPCKNVTDCMNQGKCVVDATDPRGYSCYCPLGITGTYCEDCADSNVNCEYWASIGECTRNPSYMLMNCRVSCNTCPDNPCTNNTVCQNGGSCVVNVTTARRFSCDCPPGTLDPDCESYNPCDPNPCQNGGTCNQDGSCNCTGTGFMGTTCTEINPCETATPCQNGGLCTPNGICNCSGTGFMGVTCESVRTAEANQDLNSIQESQPSIFVQACAHTETVTDYNYREVPVPDLSSRSSLVFAVKACSDAHIALSKTTNLDVDTVEIVIGAGGNTYQRLGDCRLTCSLASKNEVLLDCNEYKKFWLSWNLTSSGTGTDVILGTGSIVGSEVHLSKTLSKVLEVNHFSITSYGTVVGQWMFDFPEQTKPETCPTTEPPTTEMTTTPELTTPEETTTPEMTTTPEETTAPELTTQMTTTPELTTVTTTEALTTTETPPIITTTTAGASTQTPGPVTFPKLQKCRCAKVIKTTPQEQKKAEEAAVQAAKEIKKNLTLQTETSSMKRSKISAEDHRPTAQTVGYVGIAMLAFVFVLVLIPDLIGIGIWIHEKLAARRARKLAESEGKRTSVDESPNPPLKYNQHHERSRITPEERQRGTSLATRMSNAEKHVQISRRTGAGSTETASTSQRGPRQSGKAQRSFGEYPLQQVPSSSKASEVELPSESDFFEEDAVYISSAASTFAGFPISHRHPAVSRKTSKSRRQEKTVDKPPDLPGPSGQGRWQGHTNDQGHNVQGHRQGQLHDVDLDLDIITSADESASEMNSHSDFSGRRKQNTAWTRARK